MQPRAAADWSAVRAEPHALGRGDTSHPTSDRQGLEGGRQRGRAPRVRRWGGWGTRGVGERWRICRFVTPACTCVERRCVVRSFLVVVGSGESLWVVAADAREMPACACDCAL